MSYWIAGAATVGALADRKNPIRGAALGAGAMYGGGALLGAGTAGTAAAGSGATAGSAGLIGSEAAAGTSAGASSMTASQMFNPGTVNLANSSSLLGGAANPAMTSAAASATPASSFMSSLKPVGEALTAANAANSLFASHQTPIQASPVMQSMPNNSLGQLVNNMSTQQQSDQQLELQRRQLQRQMWGSQ